LFLIHCGERAHSPRRRQSRRVQGLALLGHSCRQGYSGCAILDERDGERYHASPAQSALAVDNVGP